VRKNQKLLSFDIWMICEGNQRLKWKYQNFFGLALWVGIVVLD